MTSDVIVLGLGGMGVATAAEIARRGVRVLGLEQFGFIHRRGSSHGRTRIIRTAYYEHPAYVPLVRRAFDLWADLEQRIGQRLLTPCPCLSVGPPGGELVRGVQRAAVEHGLRVESLSAAEIERRYPQFHIPPEFAGVLEQAAGILAVEECVRAYLDDAISHGADLRPEEPVLGWQAVAGGVEVTTAKGTYSAAKLVITAGAWATEWLSSIASLTVMRQVQWWFGDAGTFAPGCFPVFLLDTPEGAYYGMPALSELGLKCARHYGAPELRSPEDVNWDVTPGEDADVRAFLAKHLPAAHRPPTVAEVCMYTLTPDRHFVIDVHPEFPQVVVACGFSGHGFKFAPTVAEVLADLSLTGRTTHPVQMFRAARFDHRGTAVGG